MGASEMSPHSNKFHNRVGTCRKLAVETQEWTGIMMEPP
jgi:hypothetical protein